MAKKPPGGGNGSRWRRRLFTFFSAVSLLFFVAVFVLWVRSRSVVNVVVWSGSQRVYRVHAIGGRLALDWRGRQFDRTISEEADEVVDESSREWNFMRFVRANWGVSYV